MAISASLLTADKSATDGTGFTTASISPAANALILVAVMNNVYSGTAGTVTLSGNGLTWVAIDTTTYGPGSTVTRGTLFRGMGASPSTGAITITTSSSSKACDWSVVQFTGTDTSGTNGSGAIVQPVKNTTDGTGDPNTLTVTLAALGDATNNAVFVMFANDSNALMTPASGYTELSDTFAGDDDGLETQWKLPGTTTPSGTSTAFSDIGGIAVEIKAAAVGGSPYTLVAGVGAYTLSGQPVTLKYGRVVSAALGTYSLSGQAVTTRRGYPLTASVGAYSLAGQTVGLRADRKLASAVGTYSVAGQAVNTLYGRKVVAILGTYALAGQSVNTLYGRLLSTTLGTYNLSGQAVTLTYTPATGAYTIVAALGTYAVGGQDVVLKYGRVIVPTLGAYSLSGKDTNVLAGKRILGSVGDYVLAGQGITTKYGRLLSAATGEYLLTGQGVLLTYSGGIPIVPVSRGMLMSQHIRRNIHKR